MLWEAEMAPEVSALKVGPLQLRKGGPLFLIAGPCVIESRDQTLEIASFLREVCRDLSIPLIFKSSYDKANRTSVSSFRGPGLSRGLEILAEVKETLGVPVVSDVHCRTEVEPASKVLDLIQIPAFLCRQTDLLIAAAKSGLPVNVKKGQFQAPWDMLPVIEKIRHAGNNKVMISERGTCFGYNNLVVDFRSLLILRNMGVFVVFDGTHSVQLPGGLGCSSGGQREFIGPLARAAVAVGVDGVFLEVHPDPDKALCDGPNSLPLANLRGLLEEISQIHGLLSGGGGLGGGDSQKVP